VIGVGKLPVLVRNFKGELSESEIPDVRLVKNFEVILLKPLDLHKIFGFKASSYCTKFKPLFLIVQVFNRHLGYGTKPNVDKLKVSGCLCFAHKQKKNKLDDSAVRCIFIGYSNPSP